jgi:hypothetical protein
MQPDESMVIDLMGCARCRGHGHSQLLFLKLGHPVVENDGTLLTHWALCPTTGEPILMAVSR